MGSNIKRLLLIWIQADCLDVKMAVKLADRIFVAFMLSDLSTEPRIIYRGFV